MGENIIMDLDLRIIHQIIFKLLRPYCNCYLPADINIYNNKNIGDVVKNSWDELNHFLKNTLNFPSIEPCKYYKEYKENEEYVCDNFIYDDPKGKKYLKI